MSTHELLGTVVGDIVDDILLENQSTRSMYDALRDGHRKGVRVIAELKPSSPSKGELRSINARDLPSIVEELESGGAHAISVLVEPRRFGGCLENLKIARECTDLPLLAKGFLFSPRQLAECMTAGADAYLLMVRVVDAVQQDAGRLIELGEGLGMEAFIEANTPDEIIKAQAVGATILEVNNRDIYADLSLDLDNAALGKDLPTDIAFVSASGIAAAADVERVYTASNGRVDAILVGSSLMTNSSISRKVAELVASGEGVVR
ncbi:MAG: indole-3-glycerol-phosphate synthase [Candidatus Undinarchaeales archaeon]|jgi:indole-3-glycerol phosphate synthase|nr:indole-3-glycerol-phosphate synthase [Candidatus Undinarchaeales archaeon]MDP7494585.1 indole-3-glycerol-phosphate synthase [Candidatus Undinarchaeales archaeon]